MATDRITEVRIKGMRVHEDAKLDLRGVNVLIGENGSGKSTVIEALELLRRAAEPGNYDAIGDHGPFHNLLRVGSDAWSLGVTVEGEGPKLEYDFTFRLNGTVGILEQETVVVGSTAGHAPVKAMSRAGDEGVLFDEKDGPGQPMKGLATGGLIASVLGHSFPPRYVFPRLVAALRGIEVHPPFDVRPSWQQRELQTRTGPRWPSPPAALTRVKRYGEDLPAAFGILRNDKEKWERLIDRARFAVGGALQDIQLVPVGASQLEIMLKFDRNPRPVPLRVLSEGQLSFLIMLAVVELHDGRTLLALDEPDTHFHPELVRNFVQIMEQVGKTHPVVIATHSAPLLDALQDPEASVVLSELEADGSATLYRPAPGALKPWLKRYRGVGSLIAEGHTQQVFGGGKPLRNGGDS